MHSLGKRADLYRSREFESPPLRSRLNGRKLLRTDRLRAVSIDRPFVSLANATAVSKIADKERNSAERDANEPVFDESLVVENRTGGDPKR